MSFLQTGISILAAVVLFLFGLQSFSAELQTLGRDALRSWMAAATRFRLLGFAMGAAFTALVQSSSAVSAIAVALVDARVLSLGGSLAVFLGANVGTTATAWLVSAKVTGLGAIAIIVGTLLSILPRTSRVVGKSIFYFGLILFSLDLISTALDPVKSDPALTKWLALAATPWLGLLAGAVAAMLVQSSSVVSGLVVLLVQAGVLDLTGAVAIVVGANAGTTVTALIASIPLGTTAKRTALANLAFNGLGVLAFAPFIRPYAAWVGAQATSLDIAVALAHLLFNLAIAAFFLPWTRVLARLLEPRPKPGLEQTEPG